MSNELAVEYISKQPHDIQKALFDLNNANARETSLLDWQAWQTLIEEARFGVCLPSASAFLIVLDEHAKYTSPNYLWFTERYNNFLYVDRIVVSDKFRGQGLGRILYEFLFDQAEKSGSTNVFCEVNQEPPNPTSDAFHARMGFTELGTAYLTDRDKTVRYLGKSLEPSS